MTENKARYVLTATVLTRSGRLWDALYQIVKTSSEKIMSYKLMGHKPKIITNTASVMLVTVVFKPRDYISPIEKTKYDVFIWGKKMSHILNQLNYADAQILIADTMSASLEVTRNALYDQGVRKSTIAKSSSDTRKQLAIGGFDVLITQAYLKDECTAPIISDIRHGKLGDDSFVPVIALTWDPTFDVLRDFSNAGIDHLLALPMSAKKVSQVFDFLIENRKPFVVTSKYIGPERRTKPRPDRQQVPQIEVPNALRRTVTGDDGVASPTEVLRTVCDQRAERYAARIAYSINMIANLVNDKTDGTIGTWLNDLHVFANKIIECIASTSFGHHSTLCKSLLEVVEESQGGNGPDTRALALMQQLALTMRDVFSPNNQTDMPVFATK